jgi:ABC-type nickel/cobalt efflux system permease component RcnA
MRRGSSIRLTFPGCLAVCLLACNAEAHPIPKDNHDRTIEVWLRRDAVVVLYTLEVDEGRAARDLARSDLAGITSLKEFYAAYTRLQAPILAGNLDARLGGKALTFVCVDKSDQMPETGHLVCKFEFQAPWSLPDGQPVSFSLREQNYYGDDFSRLQLSLHAGAGVQMSGLKAPNEALWNCPPLERQPGDAQRLRQVSATVTVVPSDAPGEYKPTAPPDADPPRAGPKRGSAAQAKPSFGVDAAEAKPGGEPLAEASEQPAASGSLLHLLLDSRKGFAVLLLLALGLGAAHALTPGHGKTLVAAYLVGERGTVWHALFLGLVTTLTHTGAVIALAGVGYFFPDAFPATMAATELVGGLAIALLGFWLLLRRLSGQADHVHLPGQGHHHHSHGDHHHHTHVHDFSDLKKGNGVGWWHLLVLGMHGGIVPCWDAIVILSVAVSTGRLALALPLLLAFSAGLAGVLVSLGVGVVLAGRWAGARWGDHPGLRRLAGALPILSALVIMGMGLWLCYEGAHAGHSMPSLAPR